MPVTINLKKKRVLTALEVLSQHLSSMLIYLFICQNEIYLLEMSTILGAEMFFCSMGLYHSWFRGFGSVMMWLIMAGA